MNKILSLDIGDVWVGSALSDGLGLTCRPYKTVKLPELESFLVATLKEELVDTIVVGHPITVSGTKSAQTNQIEQITAGLKERFASHHGIQVTWILWDERFSTQRAAAHIGKKTAKTSKELSTKEHSVAAAFILQSYLDSRSFHEQ